MLLVRWKQSTCYKCLIQSTVRWDNCIRSSCMLATGAATTEWCSIYFMLFWEYGVPKMNSLLHSSSKKKTTTHTTYVGPTRGSAGAREHTVPTLLYTTWPWDASLQSWAVYQSFSYSQYLIHTGVVGSSLDVISRYQNTKVLGYMCIQICLREAVQYLLDTCSCSKKHTYIWKVQYACVLAKNL